MHGLTLPCCVTQHDHCAGQLSLGYGFVEFFNKPDATKALKTLQVRRCPLGLNMRSQCD